LAEVIAQKTHSPAGITMSPMGRSSVVNRSFAWFTGLVNRSSSSTAAGSSDGSARSRAISAGCISSARVPEAIRLTVDGGVETRHEQQEDSGKELVAGQPVRGAVGAVAGDERRYQVVAGPGTLSGDEFREVGGQLALHAVVLGVLVVAKIVTQWPDMLPRGRISGHQPGPRLRLAAHVRPRRAPHTVGQAFAEYGQIAKTLHLLALVDPIDDTYQRRMNRQLTVQESRHRLGRKICHGNRGQIRQAYREGQEDQLAALGLVLNAVVLWNTRYLNASSSTCARAGSRCATRTSPGSPRSVTRTSTAWAATPSPPAKPKTCDPCGTQLPAATPTTMPDRPVSGSLTGHDAAGDVPHHAPRLLTFL
jgi:hypothetical protein